MSCTERACEPPPLLLPASEIGERRLARTLREDGGEIGRGLWDRLAMHEGAGTEWFDVGFATAMKAISLAPQQAESSC